MVLEDQENETHCDDSYVPQVDHAASCTSFLVKYVTMLVFTVVLALAHARGVAMPMLVMLPLGIGIGLLVIFRALGWWHWK